MKLADGNAAIAFMYYATDIDTKRLPYCWYLEHVIRGALMHGLPDAYTNALIAVETADDPDTLRRRAELAIYDVPVRTVEKSS